MARIIKVYGGFLFINGNQCRAIVASKTKKKAAELLKISISELNHWTVSNNEIEVNTASKQPDTVFVASTLMGEDFIKFERN